MYWTLMVLKYYDFSRLWSYKTGNDFSFLLQVEVHAKCGFSKEVVFHVREPFESEINYCSECCMILVNVKKLSYCTVFPVAD